MGASSNNIIAVLALVATSAPLLAQTPPPPIVRVEGLRQISAHVHIIPDNSVPGVPNGGYASLDRLEEMKPTIIVPSHGPIGDGTGFITGYRDYLQEVRERVAAAKRAGRSVEQALDAITAVLGDRAPDKARLAGAVRAAYAEAP
jgi:glyoxylase-like metal-dependent hydrolase (beta-lactamase superfamily II)